MSEPSRALYGKSTGSNSLQPSESIDSFTMPRDRIRRDKIRVLERKLGLYTKRGLHRTAKADLSDEVKRMLQRINIIKQNCLDTAPDQLRSDEWFEREWRLLLFELGSYLWPEPDEDANAQESIDPEFYPRPLVFLDADDRVK